MKTKEAIIVYDENGKEYLLEGETDYGFLVRPIYDNPNYYYMDGHEMCEHDMEYGDIIVKKVIYKEPPKQKIEGEIQELLKRKEELEKYIEQKEKLNKQLSYVERLTPEQVFEKKLKEVGFVNAERLIKLLKHEIPTFTVTKGNHIQEEDYSYVGISLKMDNHIILLRYRHSDGDFEQVQIYDEKRFGTLEEAEKELLRRIKNGNYPQNFTYPYEYTTKCFDYDKLFDKYNEERPEKWLIHLDKIKQYQEKELQKEIDNRLNKIEELKEEIKAKQERINKIKGRIVWK